MDKKTKFQQTRLLLTKLLVIFIIAVLLLSGDKLETRSPLVEAVLFMFGCFLIGIASLGRMWCSLYIAGHKTKDLVIEGPYSICRNPLYFFSMLGGTGVGFVTETITIPVVILILFALYYPYVISFEEKKLLQLHGQQYEDYFRDVPRFWPKWSLLKEPQEYTMSPVTFKKHLFSAVWFIWLIGIMETIEAFHEMNLLPAFFTLY
jgi:protein-S-isoprenylcysteine O-methyltransferase Ste14